MSNDNQFISDAHAPAVIADEVRAAPSISVPEGDVGEVMPAPAFALEDHHMDFANFQEEYVRNYIALADTKAAWTFTIASGVLVYLIATDETKAALLAPELSLAHAFLVGSVVLLIVSALFSFRVVAPRLGSQSGEGIVFFGSVAAKADAKAYVRDISAHDSSALAEARLKHCFDVSTVCTRKYASLKKAIWFGLPALALAMAAILVGA